MAALAIPGAGDPFYDDTAHGYHVNLLSDAGFASLGEDNELSVARALMAFRLDPGIGMTDTKITNALRAAAANQLSDAVIALMVSANAAKFDDSQPVNAARVALANDFGCDLTDQAVAPKITAPASGTHLADTALPTYTWEPDGAGPSNRLDQFTVQFWSGNWDKLLFESPQQTTTSFTPTQAQFDMIYSAQDASGKLPKTINVVVKGTGTHTPATGPYKSCAITQPVDPVLTANAGGDARGPAVQLPSAIMPAWTRPPSSSPRGLAARTQYAVRLLAHRPGNRRAAHAAGLAAADVGCERPDHEDAGPAAGSGARQLDPDRDPDRRADGSDQAPDRVELVLLPDPAGHGRLGRYRAQAGHDRHVHLERGPDLPVERLSRRQLRHDLLGNVHPAVQHRPHRRRDARPRPRQFHMVQRIVHAPAARSPSGPASRAGHGQNRRPRLSYGRVTDAGRQPGSYAP